MTGGRRPLARTLLLGGLLASAGCVTEQTPPAGNSWQLTGEPTAVPLGKPPTGAQQAAQDELLELLKTPASAADLGPDVLSDQPTSPYHRLGPNVIRGIDGSWTKMFMVHAGRGAQIVEVLKAYVPGFPAEPGIPSDPALPPTEQIRWVIHQNFYQDELTDQFGVRTPVKNPSVADVLHITAPPDTLLFVSELLAKVLGDLPQIELQVRVVEVNLSDVVDWDAQFAATQLTDPDLPFDPVTNPPSGNFGAGVPIVDADGNATGIGAGFNSFSTPPTLSGFLMSLQGVHDDLRIDGLISLLQTIGSAELISSPTVTVLNGHRAKLLTGDKVPVFEASGNVLNPYVTTRFEPTGVTVEMVPFLVSEDLVRIDVSIEVSAQTGSVPFNVSGTDLSSPIISQRAAGTTVHVYSGQVFAVGGLRASTEIETITKVPLLGDIPILGWLFKSRRTDRRDTEILLIITPVVKLPSETLINPLGT